MEQHPVHQAIVQWLQQDETSKAYFRAVDRSPEVLATESPPDLFLKSCDYSVSLAARQLCNYWNFRVELFGEERAFLPLEKLFVAEEIQELNRGSQVILPPTLRGRPVICMDFSRSESNDLLLRLKIYWMLLQTLRMSESSEEVLVLALLSRSQQVAQKTESVLRKLQERLVSEASCCCKVTEIHGIVLEDHMSAQESAALLTELQQEVNPQAILRVHSSWETLREFGFQPKHLPETLGGSWSYEREFQSWLEQHSLLAPSSQKPMKNDEKFECASALAQLLGTTAQGSSSEQERPPVVPEDSSGAAVAATTSALAACPATGPVKREEMGPPQQVLAPAAPFKEEFAHEETAASHHQGNSVKREAKRDCVVGSKLTTGQVVEAKVETSAAPFRGDPVHEVILNLARQDKATTKAYLQAVQNCPDVVAQESPQEQFLAFCDFNVANAALKLCSYWSLRIQLFGPTAAFLRLSLAPQDMAGLLEGVEVTLPPTLQGRSVVCIDESRGGALQKNEDALLSRLRRLWFHLQGLSQTIWRDRSLPGTTFESVVLTVLRPNHVPSEPRLIDIRKQIVSTMCLRFVAVHGVALLNGASSLRCALETSAPVALRELELAFAAASRKVYVGETTKAVLASLQSDGFVGKRVPSSCGGEWSYGSKWVSWLVNRGVQLPTAADTRARNQGKGEKAPAQLVTPPHGSFDRDPVHKAVVAMTGQPYAPDTTAYFEAVKRCPQVVQEESPHSQFLEFSESRPTVAANRLVAYWSGRLEIFGPEAAFMPLEEALDKDAKEDLCGGALVVLPPTVHGRPVLCIDGSRKGSTPSLRSKLKNLWFATQKLSQDMWKRNSSQQQGLSSTANFDAVLLSVLHQDSRSIQTPSEARRLVLDVMCCHFVEIHGAAVIRDPASRRTLVDTIAPVTLRSLQAAFDVPPACVKLHPGDSQGEVLKNLLADGFEANCLPTTCGGNWSYDHEWPAWLQRNGLVTVASRVSRIQASQQSKDCDQSPGSIAVVVGKTSTAGVREADCHRGGNLSSRPEVSGANPGVPRAPATVHDSVHATMCSLPAALTQAYREAFGACPRMVRVETPTENYVIFCRGHIRSAARRLAMYWTMRRQVFGSSYASVPLGQVLTLHDMSALVRGDMGVVLSPGKRPESGIATPHQRRPMFLMNGTSNQYGGASWQPFQKLRMLWFLLHCLGRMTSQTSASAEEGAVCICFLDSSTLAGIPNELSSQVGQIIREAMCCRFVQLHLVVPAPGQPSAGVVMQHVLPVAMQRFGAMLSSAITSDGKNLKGESSPASVPTMVHSGGSTMMNGIHTSLSGFGIDAKDLPTSCGGNWNLETEWPAWLQQHSALSDDLSPIMSMLKPSTALAPPALQAPMPQQAKAAPTGSRLLQRPQPSQGVATANHVGAAAAAVKDEAFVRGKLINKDLAGPSLTPLRPDAAQVSASLLAGARAQVAKLACPSNRTIDGALESVARSSKLASASRDLHAPVVVGCQSQLPMQQLCQHPVHLAMLSAVPPGPSTAYMAVAQSRPELIQSETPLDRYLKFSGNATKAAQRLARYWSLRRDVFGGGANTLKPLTQCLTRRDKEYMVKGACSVLPFSNCKSARVLFVDRTKFSPSNVPSREVRLRALWCYLMLQGYGAGSEEVIDEVIVITRVCLERLSSVRFDREVVQFMQKAVSEAFCVRLSQMHFCSVLTSRLATVSPMTALGLAKQAVPALLDRLSGWLSREARFSFHAGSPEQIAVSMVGPQGRLQCFASELPLVLGGTWTLQKDWRLWLQLHGVLAPHETLADYETPTDHDATGDTKNFSPPGQAAVTEPPTLKDAEGNRIAKKRKFDAIEETGEASPSHAELPAKDVAIIRKVHDTMEERKRRRRLISVQSKRRKREKLKQEKLEREQRQLQEQRLKLKQARAAKRAKIKQAKAAKVKTVED